MNSHLSDQHGSRGRSRNSANRTSNLNQRGRHKWSSGNNARPQCQVCGKNGHIALDCWHRFDQEYQSSSNSSSTSYMTAMLTAPCTAFDPNWYPDSGVTNHVTPDPNNLTQDELHQH